MIVVLSTPLGYTVRADALTMYPYHIVKDIFGILGMVILFIFLISYDPEVFSHPDNNMMANTLVTPTHIVPEWYFLPYYAVLRSFPDKTTGVIAMALTVLLSLVSSSVGLAGPAICAIHFGASSFLSILGQEPAESPYLQATQGFVAIYFLTILIGGLAELYFSEQLLRNEMLKDKNKIKNEAFIRKEVLKERNYLLS